MLKILLVGLEIMFCWDQSVIEQSNTKHESALQYENLTFSKP